MSNLQQRNREWWDLNPMTYDSQKTLDISEGSREFFEEIDRRFFNAAFFAHQKGETPFSKLINYRALKGKQVLELGCGAGALAAVFAQQGVFIISIDLACAAVMYTKHRFEIFQLKGDVLQMDAELMGFKDETFYFIWSWGVIHHSDNTEHIVSEIYRVLKPCGQVAVMVYNRNSIYFWIYLMLFRGVCCGKLFTHSIQEICNRYNDGVIAKFYTPKQLKAIFQENNFSEIKTAIYGQKADVYPLFKSIKIWFIQFIPNSITNWLAYNFGCFLYLTASKPD